MSFRLVPTRLSAPAVPRSASVTIWVVFHTVVLPVKLTCWIGFRLLAGVSRYLKSWIVIESLVPLIASTRSLPTKDAWMSVGRTPALKISFSDRVARESYDEAMMSLPPPRPK